VQKTLQRGRISRAEGKVAGVKTSDENLIRNPTDNACSWKLAGTRRQAELVAFILRSIAAMRL